MKNKTLITQQLNAKIASLQQVTIPSVGWIKAIRTALGMSMQQLGAKLGKTKQSVQEMEEREKTGAITLRSLQDAARALDMHLVYGFVPNDGSLEALIERKAMDMASKIVLRSTHTMKLEDQEISKERIEKAIRERAEAIKNETPKILWD